jgi:serine protease Do
MSSILRIMRPARLAHPAGRGAVIRAGAFRRALLGAGTPGLHVDRVSVFLSAARGLAVVTLLGACRGQADTALRIPAGPAPFLAPLPSPDDAPDAPVDVPAVVARVRSALVSVIAGRAPVGSRVFSEHPRSAREHALGSGMLIAPEGLVLTSRHVIEGADDVRVELDDGRSFPGTVTARDLWLDIALIRLAGARGLPVVTLGSSEALRVGDPVIAVGNPFGLGPSVTRGILSAKARSLDDGPSEVFLQTDAAVNPGDSGGPLFDRTGRVVGVNTAVIAHGQGISFAGPIDDVRAALPELVATGRVARGHAGLSYQAIDAGIARALALPSQAGAIVTELVAGGPSARAGLREGDVIDAIDGRSIRSASDLAHELGQRKPGERVRFDVVRAGRVRIVCVQLDRLSSRDEDEARAAHAPPAQRGAWGLVTVDDGGGGARVDAVDPQSLTADDLRPGDVVVEVNHNPVSSAADLTSKLAAVPHPSTPLLRVRRAGSFIYVGIEVP